MTLEARELTIGFGDRVVAGPIDAKLVPGEITCLLGPNGSGKTTLLRTLLGVLPPLRGELALDGRPLGQWRARERGRRLAYVPQAAASDFDFTVLEMVEMGRTPALGLFAAPRMPDRLACLEALERLGIGALAQRPLGAVSGGERQLAYIARALATQATHILMDEPTASLDFGNQALILDEVARLAREGAAVLFTTHHPDHALRIAHGALLLARGRVLAAGAAADTLNSENLSALYGRAIEVAEVASTHGPPGRFCIVRESPRFD
jgi:iron complex transport system ATP-binding protein